MRSTGLNCRYRTRKSKTQEQRPGKDELERKKKSPGKSTLLSSYPTCFSGFGCDSVCRYLRGSKGVDAGKKEASGSLR